MVPEPFLEKIIQRIVSKFNPYKIILFGSHAYGTPSEHSDIYLLVIMDTNEKPHKRAIPIRKLLKDIGIPKDVIVKTPEEFEKFKDIIGTIVFPAAHKGKVIYEQR
ncbi:MAG: nucleotidyltransferase domain-containing protein [Proteobacteria bacterium]|nr:nucleotidyltransferase domain-containing protein [Pseudomonadota bacterium]